MGKNTSVSLGKYFEDFVQRSIAEGRYSDASEVLRAGLGLLEQEENKISALKNSIQDGIRSGLAKDFNSKKHLKSLKAGKKPNA